MTKAVRLLTLCGCAVLLASCFSYHARFQKAVAGAAGQFNDPTGPWVGKWLSNHNGHKGSLWCIITETPDKPGFYDFRYRAGWGILKFGNYVHTVETKVDAAGNLRVTGKMDLPKMLGTYSVDGTVTKTEFNAKYTSTTGDHGTMTLRRPVQDEEQKPADAPAAP